MKRNGRWKYLTDYSCVVRWGRELAPGNKWVFFVPDPPQDSPKWKIKDNYPPRNWKNRRREVEE